MRWNWASPIPITSLMTSAASSSRVERASHRPDRNSWTTTLAGVRLVPEPRSFGRTCSGRRTMRNRRPDAVNSNSTLVARSGGDKSQRTPRCDREPGTSAKRAKHTASSTLVLPAPVGPWTRNSPCRPAGAYAQSKYRGEQLLREIAGGSTLRYSIIRPPLVFGPGVGANFLALLRWIDRRAPLPLGSVNNRRSILGVANLCDLVMNLLERHADTSQDPLLVSDGQDYSTPDLIRLVAAALNRPALLLPVPPRALRLATRALGRGAAFDRLCGSLAVDCRESCDPLGWRPPTSTVDQLRSTVAWYRACGSCRNH